MNKKTIQPKLVCFCNSVSEDEIIKTITNGATSVSDIQNITTAGTGACRGSCIPKIEKLLKETLK